MKEIEGLDLVSQRALARAMGMTSTELRRIAPLLPPSVQIGKRLFWQRSDIINFFESKGLKLEGSTQ